MEIQLDAPELADRARGAKICIISYSPYEKRIRSELKSALQKHGFRVSFAGRMNGLLKEYAALWSEWGRYVPLKDMERSLYFQLSAALFRKDGDPSESLFLLLNHGKNQFWLHEAAQVRLREAGASDRLYFFDLKSARITRPRKPVLGYMEYHVSWHCNLKCKGCSHYSNLFEKPLFGDPVRYRENLLRLRELFDNIERIRLLGGEPFLNPRLGDFAGITREVFPNTDLRVVSNGLLIPTVSGGVLETLAGYGATVDISNYPPTAKVLDRIAQRLTDAGVSFQATPEKHEFRYIVGSGRKENRAGKFDHCPEKTCHFLHDDGTLSMCGMPVFHREARDMLKAERTVSDTDRIDLNAVSDGYEILKRFSQPIPFCGYCADFRKNLFFPWQGSCTEELTENDLGG